jgi:creatinine amidohydrolase
VQPLAAAARALGTVFESGADDVHAGEVETSLMMALAPDAIGDGAVDHVPSAGRDMIEMVPFKTLAPAGVWGRPSLASKDKGEAAVRAGADATASYIRESFETLGRVKKARRG